MVIYIIYLIVIYNNLSWNNVTKWCNKKCNKNMAQKWQIFAWPKRMKVFSEWSERMTKHKVLYTSIREYIYIINYIKQMCIHACSKNGLMNIFIPPEWYIYICYFKISKYDKITRLSASMYSAKNWKVTMSQNIFSDFQIVSDFFVHKICIFTPGVHIYIFF